MTSSLLETYRSALISKPVSQVWRGFGTALFLEFGELKPRVMTNGTLGGLEGEFTLMIEWSWRIENETSILCGSWSKAKKWPIFFESLINRTVVDVSLFARLPEISVALTGGLYVASLMTSTEQPIWVLFNKKEGKNISVEEGKVVETYSSRKK